MVPPATADFHQTTRKAFPDKSALLYEGNRGAVVGLNVGFDAVKLEFLKGVLQHQLQALTHQYPAA